MLRVCTCMYFVITTYHNSNLCIPGPVDTELYKTLSGLNFAGYTLSGENWEFHAHFFVWLGIYTAVSHIYGEIYFQRFTGNQIAKIYQESRSQYEATEVV